MQSDAISVQSDDFLCPMQSRCSPMQSDVVNRETRYIDEGSQRTIFPGGYPSKYKPWSTWLNFGEGAT